MNNSVGNEKTVLNYKFMGGVVHMDHYKFIYFLHKSLK